MRHATAFLVALGLAGCLAPDPIVPAASDAAPELAPDEPAPVPAAAAPPEPPAGNSDQPPAPGPDPQRAWDEYFAARQRGLRVSPPRIEDPGVDGIRSVVAVVDTGVNPFHETFRRPDLMAFGSLQVAAIDADTSAAPLYVPIRPVEVVGDGAWLNDVIEPRTLYWFAGTRLLYYSTLADSAGYDYNGHGTWTSGTVAANAPDALILMVQTDGAGLPDAVAWAARQSWIDVISLSWSCLLSCPHGYAQMRAGMGTGASHAAATRAAHDAGKLVFVSAGNDPTVHHTDPLDGPPWVVAVGGADPYRRGEAWLASKAPDVVSDFAVLAPRADHVTEVQAVSGTSLSSPAAAGTVAQAVWQLRNASGYTEGIVNGTIVSAGGIGLTSADLRGAMNRTAQYWTTTEYDPLAPHPTEPPLDAFDAGVPINPVAPWLQMGWGYVAGTMADAMADAILHDALPEKPAGAVDHMRALQDLRETLWP